MQMRRFGRTGLKVSALCLGGNSFGWTTDEAASFLVLDAYVAGGGNFIDTADAYSRWVPGNKGGESETIIGSWLKSRGNRAGVIIGTKGFVQTGPGANERGLSRVHLMHAVEGSLGRMQTDYIDLYMSHFDDLETPQEETLRAYEDLIRHGKVRYIGAGHYSPVRLMRALWTSDKHGWARYESIEPEYNLFTRAIYEGDLESVVIDQGLAVITRSSLASGFLTGKYRRGSELPQSLRVPEVQRLYATERGFSILDELDKVAAQHNATVAQIALAWIMARPSVTAPIASATSIAQVQELVQATQIRLSPESLDALNAVSRPPDPIAG
jgi:aryl-alcohol dehydrogenase-like predicted oxidoreductase